MVRLMGSATGVPPMRRLHDLHGRAFHEPAVSERGSVTRRTWGCSDALRLTEPRSHRVVRFMVPMHAKKRKGATHEPHEFQVHAPIEGGETPPHSTTLAPLAVH